MRRGQRAAHGWMAYAMALAIAAILFAAFIFAQSRGDLPPPERLSPPAAEGAAS